MTRNISFHELRGKQVLITGDVGTGKTQLTIQLLQEAMTQGLSSRITIIDMAPTTRYVKHMKVGGKLNEVADNLNTIRYFTPLKVETPRLSATSTHELQHLVSLNKRRITPHLQAFIHAPSPILFINDISIYLQSGSLELVTQALQAAETCIANGYYGQALHTTLDDPISHIERKLMDQLSESMDVIIRL
jgi:hypothetical protein